MESIEEMTERYKREREIVCPHCNELQANDDCQYPVTYHGSSDNGYAETDCQSCGKEFFVDEIVQRTYRVGKTEKELNRF
jgi:hypothetical protein